MTNTEKTAFGLIGYPAAGKSYSVDVLEDSTFNCEGIAIGDVVRDILSSHPEYGPNPTGSEIREWVTTKLEEDDEAVITEVVNELDTKDPDGFMVIDGIRTPADVRVLNEYFDNFALFYIDSPDEVRLERIQDRGRDEEANFTMNDLKERDSDEEAWGLREIIQDNEYDFILESHYDGYEENLKKGVRLFLEEWNA